MVNPVTENKLTKRQLGQSRAISESRYKTTKDEKRLLMLAMVSEHKDKMLKDRWFDFKLSEYAKTFNISMHESSRDTQKAIEELQNRWIFLKQDDGGYEKVRWIDGIRSDTRYGKKGIRFTQEMVEVLKNNIEVYSYQLSEIVGLSSPEHIRIYDWVYDSLLEDGTGEVTLELQEMLERMQLHNHKSYRMYGNFKRVVMVPAINKINELTSLKVEYEEIKEGKKVVAVRFVGTMDLNEINN